MITAAGADGGETRPPGPDRHRADHRAAVRHCSRGGVLHYRVGTERLGPARRRPALAAGRVFRAADPAVPACGLARISTRRAPPPAAAGPAALRALDPCRDRFAAGRGRGGRYRHDGGTPRTRRACRSPGRSTGAPVFLRRGQRRQEFACPRAGALGRRRHRCGRRIDGRYPPLSLAHGGRRRAVADGRTRGRRARRRSRRGGDGGGAARVGRAVRLRRRSQSQRTRVCQGAGRVRQAADPGSEQGGPPRSDRARGRHGAPAAAPRRTRRQRVAGPGRGRERGRLGIRRYAPRGRQ